MNAVDSEHEKNLVSDNRRILQIDKVLAVPTHDYAKFGTGNKSTLIDNLQAKSLNVRDELIKFHRKYYSSNIMAATILAKGNIMHNFVLHSIHHMTRTAL